jgi:serine/threonine protein kinase
MTAGWLSDAAVDRLRDVADWPEPPSGRYDILEPLARGGMGTVYRARDRELERDVAVKVLSATAPDEALARMQQEARVLARLEHPGIVPIYDVGTLVDGRIFYVMKLVAGPRLDEHVADRRLSERLRRFGRICEPVAFAHAHGVVHRDLKPDNVMVGPFGEVLVMDWGAAQVRQAIADRGSGASAGAWVVGTTAYMPPEQARGETVDARADVYALGGILHFMLAGGSPDAAPLRGPRSVQAICRKARSPVAADRYPDVASLSADVDRFLAGEPVAARPENALEAAARLARKHRAAIAIITTYLTLRYVIAWLSR